MKRGPKPGNLMGRKKAAKNGFARNVLEARIKELVRRTDEQSKAEAARLAIALLPFEVPKLQAITQQVESKVVYVARLPQPILDITEWQKQTAPLLSSK
jgi:hypothetical protein